MRMGLHTDEYKSKWFIGWKDMTVVQNIIETL